MKTAGMGGLLGGLGLGLLILLINLGMIAKLDRIASVDMPTLFLANEIASWLALFMAVVLLGMIFNTAVGMLYAFSARLVQPDHPRFKGFVDAKQGGPHRQDTKFIKVGGHLFPLAGGLYSGTFLG